MGLNVSILGAVQFSGVGRTRKVTRPVGQHCVTALKASPVLPSVPPGPRHAQPQLLCLRSLVLPFLERHVKESIVQRVAVSDGLLLCIERM